MFVPREGWVFVDADYSQIELRVLAHIADDDAMCEAFRSGADFHTVTASQVFGVPVEDVTPLMRRKMCIRDRRSQQPSAGPRGGEGRGRERRRFQR